MFRPIPVIALLVAVTALIGTISSSTAADTPTASVAQQTYQGKTIMQWHSLAVRRRVDRDWLQKRLGVRVRQVRAMRHALVHRADSDEALRLAATTYHVSYDFLYALASCESTGGNGLNMNAKNRGSTAAGLGQFLDSTWSATIYRGFSVYSPYANALAMGKEVADGHAGWQWAASRSCWSRR